MSLVLPRGIIYHKVSDDIKWLIQATYKKLDDQKIIKEFEMEFSLLSERKHCIAFPFARTAIYHALQYKNFKPGTEIIMPPISIKAILDVILELGLKPVFVDIDPETLCFDLDKLAMAVNENTGAVLITYLFGMVPHVAKMSNICRDNNLFIIEDFSQCLNGKFAGQKTGTFGDAGVYSASSTKTLDTYGGGMLVCDDDELYQAMLGAQQALAPTNRKQLLYTTFTDLIRNVATTRPVFHFIVFPLLKLVAWLKPEISIKHTGDRDKQMISELPPSWFTCFSSFQAEVGLKLLKTLKSNDRNRIDNVNTIKSTTTGLQFPSGTEQGENIYWQLVAYFEHPHDIQKYLHANKIDTSTTSLLNLADLPDYPYQGKTPNADRLHSKGCFIPAFPGLSSRDIQHLCTVLNDVKLSKMRT